MERVVIADAAAVTGSKNARWLTVTLQFLAEPSTLTNAMGFGQLSTDAGHQ
jgi:hypothetical protein